MPRRTRPVQHTRFSLNAPCAHKRRFSSEQKALAALAEGELLDMNVHLTTYECPYCGGWHLSSVKP